MRNLQRGNIAPVDLAQASIGPGMAVFTRYAKVMESDGLPMIVRTALGLINQSLDSERYPSYPQTWRRSTTTTRTEHPSDDSHFR